MMVQKVSEKSLYQALASVHHPEIQERNLVAGRFCSLLQGRRPRHGE
jgi:hypothetical protein